MVQWLYINNAFSKCELFFYSSSRHNNIQWARIIFKVCERYACVSQKHNKTSTKFSSFIDFSKLERSCQKRPLENHYISVQTVPISNCVCVSGFSKNTSERTLEYYFDNTRQSGGKDVTDVKFNDEDNTCLVYFEDHAGTKNFCSFVCHIHPQASLSLSLTHLIVSLNL